MFYQIGTEHFQMSLDNIVCLYSEFGRKIHLELVSGSDTSFYGGYQQLKKNYLQRILLG